MNAFRIAVAVLVALFAHWSASVLPLVHFGSVAVPGFAVAATGVSLALLAGVVWFAVRARPLRAVWWWA